MRRVKIAVDLGNSMLKVGAYIDGEFIYKKLPNKIQHSKTISPKARKIQRDNHVIFLGVGKLNNNVLKHTRSNLLEQVLVMIHELFPFENHLIVDLVTGLPPAQLFNEAYLKQFEDIFLQNRIIEYTVDKYLKKVEISSLEVKAEGYSGFVAIVDKLTTKQDILSIDVGGGTIDLCNYQFDYEDNIYYPDMTETIEYGCIDFAEEIATSFNNQHGADIKSEQIEYIFKNNLEFIEYEGKKYLLNNYLKALNPLLDNIFNKITNKYGKLNKYAVVGLGGGYKIFYKVAANHIVKNIDLDEEVQFVANLLGYLWQ